MSRAIPPLPQYVFVAWCSVKAQGQLYFLLYSTLKIIKMGMFPVITDRPTDWLTNWLTDHSLTHFMKHSPSWEANSHSDNRRDAHLLWDPKVHYHVHNSPPLVLIPTQMNPIFPCCDDKDGSVQLQTISLLPRHGESLGCSWKWRPVNMEGSCGNVE